MAGTSHLASGRMPQDRIQDAQCLQTWKTICKSLKDDYVSNIEESQIEKSNEIKGRLIKVLQFFSRKLKKCNAYFGMREILSTEDEVDFASLNLDFLEGIRVQHVRDSSSDSSPEGKARRRVGIAIRRSIEEIERAGMPGLASFLKRYIERPNSLVDIRYEPPPDFSGIWRFDDGCDDATPR